MTTSEITDLINKVQKELNEGKELTDSAISITSGGNILKSVSETVAHLLVMNSIALPKISGVLNVAKNIVEKTPTFVEKAEKVLNRKNSYGETVELNTESSEKSDKNSEEYKKKAKEEKEKKAKEIESAIKDLVSGSAAIFKVIGKDTISTYITKINEIGSLFGSSMKIAIGVPSQIVNIIPSTIVTTPTGPGLSVNLALKELKDLSVTGNQLASNINSIITKLEDIGLDTSSLSGLKDTLKEIKADTSIVSGLSSLSASLEAGLEIMKKMANLCGAKVDKNDTTTTSASTEPEDTEDTPDAPVCIRYSIRQDDDKYLKDWTENILPSLKESDDYYIDEIILMTDEQIQSKWETEVEDSWKTCENCNNWTINVGSLIMNPSASESEVSSSYLDEESEKEMNDGLEKVNSGCSLERKCKYCCRYKRRD